MRSWRPIRSRQKNKSSQASTAGANDDAWHLPLSLEEGRGSPTGRSPGSGSSPDGLLPKATASVDLVHGSSVTVTGSRRTCTGFPFQLFYEPPVGVLYLCGRAAGITSYER